MKFLTPDLSDKRIIFASDYLERNGHIKVENEENADFVLLGVNPDKKYLNYSIPIFAGNVRKDKVFDYTKEEAFAIKNAYLTAEGALSLAIKSSETSLINSSVLIVGYGRIGKALLYYIKPFSNDITVCSRSEDAKADSSLRGAKETDFLDLGNSFKYDFIFNTVPHPVINAKEMKGAKENALIIDLASFPGGVDAHYAKAKGINLIAARGLPGKFSPASAGKVVGETVYKMIKEVMA